MLLALLTTLIAPCQLLAQDRMPYIADGLLDTTQVATLGLPRCGTSVTMTIFSPADEDPHYANGAVMTVFRDTLYCMWQSSLTDEDAPETCVLYSTSGDEGATWSTPRLLAAATDSAFCTSGGWLTARDTLTAFINTWGAVPVVRYVTTTDGRTWSAPQPVTMADGSPMNGIMEQDPCTLADGRIVGAVHFSPGLHVMPVVTDSPTGHSGWRRAQFRAHDRGKQSQELEPSQYVQRDSTLVMVFRDQGGSFRKMAALSHDRGETWTDAAITNIPDARVKQSAGNLPDGTAFLAGCPSAGKQRYPLAVLFSADGVCFDRGVLLRSGAAASPTRPEGLQPQRWTGRYKTLGYSYPKSLVWRGRLYVVYATNKEDVECTIISCPKMP